MSPALRLAPLAAAAILCAGAAQAADPAPRARRAQAVEAAPITATTPLTTTVIQSAVPETYFRAGCPRGPLSSTEVGRSFGAEDCLPPRIARLNHVRYIIFHPVTVEVDRR